VATATVLHHKAGLAELAKVLGDGGPGYREGFRDLAGGLFPAAKQIENGAPGGIGKRVKRGFRGICNRLVPHNA
jgi:hypothetical protein